MKITCLFIFFQLICFTISNHDNSSNLITNNESLKGINKINNKLASPAESLLLQTKNKLNTFYSNWVFPYLFYYEIAIAILFDIFIVYILYSVRTYYKNKDKSLLSKSYTYNDSKMIETDEEDICLLGRKKKKPIGNVDYGVIFKKDKIESQKEIEFPLKNIVKSKDLYNKYTSFMNVNNNINTSISDDISQFYDLQTNEIKQVHLNSEKMIEVEESIIVKPQSDLFSFSNTNKIIIQSELKY